MSNLKTPNKEIERKFLVDINKWNNLYSTFNKIQILVLVLCNFI